MLRSIASALLAAAVAVPLAAQSNIAAPEKFTAFAVNVSNMTERAAAGPVDITINRWSTDAERDRLKAALHEGGNDGLLSELQKLPVVGRINTPGALGYDLRFARQRPEAEGGRMITLATDRYIGAWEAANRPRTIDYPFMVIQLKVDRSGKGEGKASVYTRITEALDGTIELENYADQPVLLNSVRRLK